MTHDDFFEITPGDWLILGYIFGFFVAVIAGFLVWAIFR